MRTLSLDDLHLFTRVAALGSLSGAARERNAPASQVSRTLARIESCCGAKLAHRTTHALTLTPEGEAFLAHCQRMLASLDELEGEFSQAAATPRGLVRVAASSVVVQHRLLPSLPALAKRHPELRIDMLVGDRLSDLAREGIDIAVRTAETPPPGLVARQLGLLGRGLFASPAYLAHAGTPVHPSELGRHQLITNSAATHLNRWVFQRAGQRIEHVADGHWRADDTGVVASLALQGLGIGRIATFAAAPLVQTGQLAPVLADWTPPAALPIYAMTPPARHRLPKIRACLDFWSVWFGAAEPKMV
ncbi:MAG: LysR family transcriptional regulator [Proteobacteria bacterium]|nr:LysR family transcriptional regulator [Pseudomonadota bacterium]